MSDCCKRRIRIAAAVIFMVIAGICYSCTRTRGGEELLIAAEETPEGGTEKSVSAQTEAPPETEAVPVFYVHICGAVAQPGVYQVEEGSRVFQVVDLAGGFSEGAAMDYLNMADPVSDGMKLVVPSEEELASWEAYGAGGTSPGAQDGGKVNINTADREALMTLKGIGEARADDIIRYREENGGFQKIEDIMNVSGIKDAAFEKIRDDITV